MKNKLRLAKNIYFKKNKPVSLIIFLTERCNARCSFCFIDFDPKAKGQQKENEISVEDFKTMSLSLKDSLHHLNFTGGEPFLRSDFDQIISNFIENCDLSSVVISTNGSYPNKIKKFLETVCSKYPTTKFVFQFSIDSFPEKHNIIRKIPGLFDRTIESYNIVKKSYENCLSTCNLTISEDNYQDIEKIYDYLTEQQKIETINPIVVRNEGVYDVPPESKVALIEAYKKITKKNIDNVDNGKLRGFSNFDLEGKVINEKNKIQYEMISETYLKPKFYTNCVAGSIFGVVTSDGNVLPCEILDNDKALGNLKDYDFDFMKLWNDTKANETRKWIKDTKCNCHWECIFTYNLISSPKYVASMATKILKSK